MFELCLHYYKPPIGLASDIVLFNRQTQQCYAWFSMDIDLVKPEWHDVTKHSEYYLRVGYIRGSPLSFLILTGKDYYSNLPKEVCNA